ncbi:hypothetical protein [Priestia megaterium]|nr:hypothetical protein [Priestia megaterium]
MMYSVGGTFFGFSPILIQIHDQIDHVFELRNEMPVTALIDLGFK